MAQQAMAFPSIARVWHSTRALIVIGMVGLLTAPALAESNPKLSGCVYRTELPAKDTAERIMQLTLPYLDKQIIYYRGESGIESGYAVRRSLRVYFYEGQKLLGTAIRRSQAQTSYFSPDGGYLGQCTNRKLIQPDNRSVRFNPQPR
jgi:hypothetical protein